jgi:hypothetical protein
MNYNPLTPIAVFLGPSLDFSVAQELLDANYYPPAKMGDIYRLLGTGVTTIILIDGIFHTSPSIWQREILEAIRHGIKVIGASSMGALRAAELHLFGMVGRGTIFEWYRDGIINGDDEVALNYVDESMRFRALSEPLVNIRFNLLKAVSKGYITQEECDRLITYVKQFCYWKRSSDLILYSEVFKALTTKKKENLSKFLRTEFVDLKCLDAAQTLKEYKGSLFEEKIDTSSYSFKLDKSCWSYVNLIKRGVFYPNGCLIDAEKILNIFCQNKINLKKMGFKLSIYFFLLKWSDLENLICPDDYLIHYKNEWKNKYVSGSKLCWLRHNGLTEKEFDSKINQRALIEWMLSQDLEIFGINFSQYEQCIQNSSYEFSELIDFNDFQKAIKARLIISLFAHKVGIVCPDSEICKFRDAWYQGRKVYANSHYSDLTPSANEMISELALSSWMIEKQPTFFGYRSWHPYAAIFEELQLTGKASNIAQEIIESN